MINAILQSLPRFFSLYMKLFMLMTIHFVATDDIVPTSGTNGKASVLTLKLNYHELTDIIC